ncbi:MAG: DUF2058 family protein [Rhodanobacter sp.]|nr:MAG: DUF2058 family protein [Rhodanobacter sp.]TAM38460.1 MAG: DUF2058 family protein [Rhodanobacter sp.]TAN27026.1 MAG: DUF2058 family protein [Rhodanobacter sp.]
MRALADAVNALRVWLDHPITLELWIPTLEVAEPLHAQLVTGTLVIVNHGEGYVLLPRTACGQGLRTLCHDEHARPEPIPASDAGDKYYKQFEVSDDLIR